MLDRLTPRQRLVISLRYGLADGTARSLADVGQCLDLSRERVRQIEAEALEKMLIRMNGTENAVRVRRTTWPKGTRGTNRPRD
jgi:DNA-directed RNA polymerase sigma subunit (sigma70/sigma32)